MKRIALQKVWDNHWTKRISATYLTQHSTHGNKKINRLRSVRLSRRTARLDGRPVRVSPRPSRPSDLISGRGGEIEGKGGVVAPAAQSSFSGAPIVGLTSISLRMNIIALGSVCKTVDHLEKVAKFFWRLGLSWSWQMASSHFNVIKFCQRRWEAGLRARRPRCALRE